LGSNPNIKDLDRFMIVTSMGKTLHTASTTLGFIKSIAKSLAYP
jgi:hypothetical protein